MLLFLIEKRLIPLAILALLSWIVGVVGGGLLIKRMRAYEELSIAERERKVMTPPSDQLLAVGSAFFAAVGAIIAQVAH
jgi:hypothetical protein